MPDILYPPSRPQSVGEILDSTFRIFRATVLKSLPYAALALIAGQIPNVYYLLTGGVQAIIAESYSPLWWVLYCVGLVVSLMLWSAILLRQHAAATGDAAAGSAAFSTVLRRLPALVLLWILITAAVGLCLLPARAFRPPAEYGVGTALLIPATYVTVALSCAWAAFLLAGKGPLASLAYSWRLTSGSFWRLSLIYSVALVVIIVLYVLSGVLAAALALPFAHGDVAVITAVSTVVVVILGAIGTPFYSALALTVFGDLSVRKEGTDLAQRISAPAG
jgi:hypothetical protein